MKLHVRARTLGAAALLALAVAGLSAAQADARPKHPPDNGVRCAYINPETGEIEFFLPGQNVFPKDGNGDFVMLTCGEDGNWHARPAASTSFHR